MKRLLIALFFAASIHAQTVNQSLDQLGQTDTWVLSFRWTASDGTRTAVGSVPVTPAKLGGCCAGYLVTQVETVPGSVAPTSGYSVQINDSSSLDFLGGGAASLSSTIPQSFAAASSAPPVQGFSLVITGQSVASATGAVFVFLAKPGTVSLLRVPTQPGAFLLNNENNSSISPPWSSLPGGVYYGVRQSVNNFPLAQEFQGAATQTVAGVDGAVDGPLTAFNGAILGGSFYARTNYASTSGGTAAVGLFAAGYNNVNATGSNVSQNWAANFSVKNCGTVDCTTGFGNNNSYGLEIDVNMYPSVGAAVSNAQGLWITGGSTIQPSGVADAVHIGALGQFTSPQIKWKNAIEVDPGSAIVAFLAGTADSSASPSGCMPIRLTSRSGGGINQFQQITCDSAGDIIFQPGTAAGQVVLEDFGGNVAASLVPNGSTPYFSIMNQLRMGASGSLLVPALASSSGTNFICSDTAGLLHKSASACSGT